jgi:hypothetical protein
MTLLASISEQSELGERSKRFKAVSEEMNLNFCFVLEDSVKLLGRGFLLGLLRMKALSRVFVEVEEHFLKSGCVC